MNFGATIAVVLGVKADIVSMLLLFELPLKVVKV